MAEDTVNGGATNPPIDTELTRVRSLDVHARKRLEKNIAKSVAELSALNAEDRG